MQVLKEKNTRLTCKNITSRGNWYQNSWKGDIEKRGGIATNIGVHFFNVLLWIFGSVEKICHPASPYNGFRNFDLKRCADKSDTFNR